jgi:uncharacterized cofD-like protein
MVHGEHNISERGAAIKDLFLNPPWAEAHPDAVRAILDADLIVIGPGSLYTSVLPNILVEGIRKALYATTATKVFVCNVATQHGETDGFTALDHLEAIERHTGAGLVHAVVVNNNIAQELPKAWKSNAVGFSRTAARSGPALRIVEADVVAEENRYRHDPQKLAATILRLYDERDAIITPAARQPSEAPVLAVR